MENAETIGRLEVIAECCIPLASILIYKNQLTEAFSYANRAVEIYTNLRHKDLSTAQKLLTEIEHLAREKEKTK